MTKHNRNLGLTICSVIAAISISSVLIEYLKHRKEIISKIRQEYAQEHREDFTFKLPKIEIPTPTNIAPFPSVIDKEEVWKQLYIDSNYKYEEAVWNYIYYLDNVKNNLERENEFIELKAMLIEAHDAIEREYTFIFNALLNPVNKDTWNKRMLICFMHRGNIQRIIKLLED